MVDNLAFFVSDDDAILHHKKRKRKKQKIGKNGLYSEEELFVGRWWKTRRLADVVISAGVSRDEEAKRHIANLRLRETQLQILLILETMVLETLVSSSQNHGSDSVQQEPGPMQPKSKTQDLNVLLELLLDRLCIWHTVSSNGAISTDSAKGDIKNDATSKGIESDALRDFCTEIIIPFYSSRLPEQCKSIKRKLGGSSLVSPPRRAPNSKKTQPVAATKQPQHQKTRPTLQRVLTDERLAAFRKVRPPSLLRSSTAPSCTDVKRESVEPLLPSSISNVRGGILKPKRVENREVDLDAVAKQHEAKLKKMNTLIEQKRELDAAISALRKPNRELIAKEIADVAEQRASSGSSRKSKNPVRNPLAQGVQVMATPKGSRKMEVTVGLPSLPRCLARPSVRQEENMSSPLQSDTIMIPSSTVRPGHVSQKLGSSRLGLSGFGTDDINSIFETPSKPQKRPEMHLVNRTPTS